LSKAADLVVCLPTKCGNPGGFDDNVYGKCCVCEQAILWRPHSPELPKVCIECFSSVVEPGDELVMTPQSREELRRLKLK